jgi:hypothetical protein
MDPRTGLDAVKNTEKYLAPAGDRTTTPRSSNP